MTSSINITLLCSTLDQATAALKQPLKKKERAADQMATQFRSQEADILNSFRVQGKLEAEASFVMTEFFI